MKYLVNGLFIVLSLIVNSAQGSDGKLRFSYWDDATPPFILERDGVVHSGIIKDLAEKVAAVVDGDAEFVKLPVARIEPQLQSGVIDIDCLTSPIWKESPSSYNWSPVILNGADRFLVWPEFASKLNAFDDLRGMTLGIYNGYVYHPEIMRMIKENEISTIKVKGLEHGIQLLKLKRLDALIDFGILLKYQLKTKGLSGQLVLADLPADEYDLHCAYSKKMKIPAEMVNSIFEQLKKTGEVGKILNRYQ